MEQSPVVTIKEQGKDLLTIAESGAICEYLVERYGGESKGLGVSTGGDAEKRAMYLFWMHFAEGVSFAVRDVIRS